MAKYQTEEPDFNRVHCWECGEEMESYYVTFFLDEEGLERYGAVCQQCVPKVKKRKITIVHGGLVKPDKVVEEATEVIKEILSK